MSALTDLFTALANKIRSKTGTATTYTPLEMVSDGIDDVYDAGYAAGGGGSSATPITPSNSSPASMSAGTAYEPTANGYAIASYSSVTPSNSSPVSLSSGSIYKMGGNGKAVASVTDVTPSNSSPVSLTSGTVYKMGGAGKAVASVTDITPSNTTPASMSSDTIYNSKGIGYAITSYQTLTPSNSSPPSIASGTIYKGGGSGHAISSYAASDNLSNSTITPSPSGAYFYSGWNKMTAAGYAYSSQPAASKAGTATLSTSSQTTITLGFKPKYICFRVANNSNPYVLACYDERFSTTKYLVGTTSGSVSQVSVGTTNAFGLSSISSTGFTVNKAASSATTALSYFAIG